MNPLSDAELQAEKLQKQLAAQQAEIERIRKLTELYPDLHKYVGRWEKIVYCSKSVNILVNNFETRHNCGCCNDSPLEVWPFLETPHGRVYSNPTGLFIGNRKWRGYGDEPCIGWEDKLRKEGIPESLVTRIGSLFPIEETENDDG